MAINTDVLLILAVPNAVCWNAEFTVAGVAFVGLVVKEPSQQHTICYVSYNHMKQLLHRHKLQYQNLIDKLNTMHHPQIRKASSQELKILLSRKVLKKGATLAMLISLQSASKCCRLLGMPTPVCERLANPEAGIHMPTMPI